MCSRLLQIMENFQGDLTDILRAGSGGITTTTTVAAAAPAEEVSSTSSAAAMVIAHEWQFPTSCKDFLQMADHHQEVGLDEFGDPFSNMRDPLLHEMDMQSSALFTSSTSRSSSSGGGGGGGGGGGNTMLVTQRITDDEIITRRQPCLNSNKKINNSSSSSFSTMLQISPNAKLPVVVSPQDASQVMAAAAASSSPLVTNELINNSKGGRGGGGGGSLGENGGMQQISSPRNTGMKRRKSQAKKVVCIPAPSPANSRPSGEIVPSDLWAWRKYGQKPIKGSPYPRGYYRCSSSKGCSARKQVERSRTDPNMLVITYTSEHNHPWPTQRNALAGSTRTTTTQPSSTIKTASNPSPKVSKSGNNLKEEEPDNAAIRSGASTPPTVVTPSSRMKEEMDHDHDHHHHHHYHHHDHDNKQMEILDHDSIQFSINDSGFQQSYRPALPDSNHHHHSEDFFADLGELEAGPLDLLLGYSGDEEPESKTLESFSFYDWVNNATTTTACSITTSVEEVSKGL